MILTAVVAVVALAGCSADADAGADKAAVELPEPIPFGDIDQAAWTEDLQATGRVRATPDLEALYDLAKKDCAAEDPSDLAMGLTLVGAMPDVDRINMQYICPSKAHLIDDALSSIQDASSSFEEACALAPNLRTEEQQDMVEAVEVNPSDCP